MMAPGMRFPPHLPPFALGPDERLEEDESGGINWRLQWLKELGHLQSITQSQEKDGAPEEWYKQMFIRVRTALLGLGPNEGGMIPNQMPPPPGNPVEQQQ